MTLLEDIQKGAVDGSQDLGTLLRKCKVLAAKLGSKPLEDWVQHELDGYPKGVAVPEYRIWKLTLKGHFAGPFGSAFNNAPIPMATVPKEAREAYERYECRESVAALEQLAAKDAYSHLSISTGDLALLLGEKVYKGMNCVQAWAEIEHGRVVGVVNSVRNRILDLTLALWKESPEAGQGSTPGSDAVSAAKATQIFQTTVYGGTANIVGSANASTINFGVSAGDFESLAKVLRANGVQDPDVSELKAALEADPKPADGKLGPKVSSWIGKMIQKASSGGWDIAIQAAGAILGQAILKYYGLG